MAPTFETFDRTELQCRKLSGPMIDRVYSY